MKLKKWLDKRLGKQRSGLFYIVVIALLVGVIGVGLQLISHALTPTADIEAENGTVGSCATSVSDGTASGGGAVKFGTCSTSSGDPAADAGASLPISYSLGSLTGTIYYVATTGSDSAAGTAAAPFATLSKAISTAAAGSTIVVRGGTYYNQGGLSIAKTLKIIAYPGETPVFDGAQAVATGTGWTTSGSTKSHAYTPIPATDGSGITDASTGQGLADPVGKYPDQVWIGNTELDQVATQGAVAAGKFWVDTTNNLVYISSTDFASGNIEDCKTRTFAQITGANVTLQGFKIIRYCNTASDNGVINVLGTADNTLFQDMYIADTSFQSVLFTPSSGNDLNQNSTVKDSTIIGSNWMGLSALATNYLTLDHDDIGGMNRWGEFNSSPKSGSLKTSRTWYTTVKNSKIHDNKSVGLWFDQSNYKVTVANNHISGITGASIFFEISDFLYAVNNYIDASGGQNGIEMSGSTNTYLVNNTVVGGNDPVASYTDSRSIAGCSTGATSGCGGASSDIDQYHTHQATLTWIPSINLMLNNIIGYPDGARYCSAVSAVCATLSNGSASETVDTWIHGADASKGIPQTLFDGNVLANGSGKVVNINTYAGYTTVAAFASAMAGSPVNISGFETHGLTGNTYFGSDGKPTGSLNHSGAAAVPTNTNINPYIPAGTKHYGILWQ